MNISEHIRQRGNAEEYRPHGCSAGGTDAQPGSAAKIEVLRERIEAGVELWHPADLSCLPELGDICRHKTEILPAISTSVIRKSMVRNPDQER